MLLKSGVKASCSSRGCRRQDGAEANNECLQFRHTGSAVREFAAKCEYRGRTTGASLVKNARVIM
jgi:hypothetical protein